MAKDEVRPTGVRRTFGTEEIIVTKTDTKGLITYANGVFLRVSQLTEAETIGRPHNLIRHPDMPACVFRLLWDTIGQGRELFAYVLNLATDGAHYWVFAHITPSFAPNGSIIGYHSNRRMPEDATLEQVAPLYATLRAEERRHRSGSAAVEASAALFQRTLAERNSSYEDWVWGITPDEPSSPVRRPAGIAPGSPR